MRRVKVFWHKGDEKLPIAELAHADRAPIAFEWDTSFLTSSIELSPIRFKKKPGIIIANEMPFHGLPGLIADNIPDGWGRILLRHAFSTRGLSMDEVSPLDMLSFIGDRGMGALTFEPTLYEGESWAKGKVNLDELESGIEPILSGTPSTVIETFLEAGSSANGIRPKIIASEINGELFVGGSIEDENASEWIIKFQSPDDAPDSGKIEYIYSLMAKDAGLRMPETKLFTTKKGSFFGVKRFDRKENKRIHMHTLSGLLEVDPRNWSVSYNDLAKVASVLTKDMNEFEQIFRLATFNVFSINRDDHTKNVSFLMDEDGTWQFAPAYDLTFLKGIGNEHKMPIGNTGKPEEKDLLNFAEDFGMKKKKSMEIIEEVKGSLSQFRKLSRKYDVLKAERDRVAKEINLMLSRGKSKGISR